MYQERTAEPAFGDGFRACLACPPVASDPSQLSSERRFDHVLGSGESSDLSQAGVVNTTFCEGHLSRAEQATFRALLRHGGSSQRICLATRPTSLLRSMASRR